MKQDDDKPIPYLLELKDEIKINSSKWTMKTIRQTERDLHSIICQLKNVHNSKLKINQLDPDILYDIFTMAMYLSSPPTAALLNLSHVCHHWRQSALGWPALWALVELDSAPAIVDLFLERSQDAPLTLLLDTLTFDEAPSKSFFVHHANYILSRLSGLIISATYAEFIPFYNVLQHSGLPPLQLRHCEIRLHKDSITDNEWPAQPLIAHVVDGSCLQKIELGGLDLPWLELPLNNITHLTLLYPMTLPTPSQFLVFLSNCCFLRVLELDFADDDNFGHHRIKSTSAITTPTSLPSINKLVLSLTGLTFVARGPSSCEFIQRISERIQISGVLSSFALNYIRPSRVISGESDSHQAHLVQHQQDVVPTWPLPVPSGTFAHFSNCRCLKVDVINTRYGEMRFHIRGYTFVSDRPEFHPCPFFIWCEGLPYSLILELVHDMPEIQHLQLNSQACEILTLQSLDARSAFPCLHTLELVDCTTQELNSLPMGLQLKTLILNSCTVSFEVLFDVVLRLNVKALDLLDTNADDLQQCANVISTLRKRGVCVFKKIIREY